MVEEKPSQYQPGCAEKSVTQAVQDWRGAALGYAGSGGFFKNETRCRMRMRIFKRKKRVDGKSVESVTWYGEYRIDGMICPKVTNLCCTDKQVAYSRLQKMVAEEEKTADGILPSHSIRSTAKTLLTELLKEYLERLQKLNRSKPHIRNNRDRIGQLIDECRWRYVKDVAPESFEAWRDDHLHLAPKTLNDYLSLANTFFNWLVKYDRLNKNPLLRVTTLERQMVKPRRAFSDREFNNLVSVAPPRRRIVYLLAAYTGLRRGELKQLRWGDLKIQGDEAWLAVRASTTKNRKSANMPLRREIVQELLAIKPEYSKPEYLMLKCKVPKMERFKKDLQLAGVKYVDQEGRVADFHSLRHTFATNLSKSGVTPRIAMEMMRHSDMKLTMKTYTDVSQLPVTEALNKLPWLGGKNEVTEKVTAFLVQNGQKQSQVGKREVRPVSDNIEDSTSVCQGLSRGVLEMPNKQNAESTGLEPATPAVTGRCSDQLSYNSKCE